MMFRPRACGGALVALLLSIGAVYAQEPAAPAPAPAPAPTPVAPQVPAPPPPAGPAAAQRPTTRVQDALGYLSRQWRIERIDANHIRLVGQVEVERDKLKFFADQVDIYSDTNLMVAEGNVVFVNEGSRLAAERMEFDLKKQVGTFYEASGIATLQPNPNRGTLGGQDADVMFYGSKIEKVGEKKYRLTDGAFTTCVQPTPRWEMSSGTITLNLDEYAVATNMVMKVKGVPLFYLPAIYYPIDKQERSTGFLMPTYGTSTLRGQSISNAFFWALSRSKDATFFHDWFTRTGQGVGGEYRYVTLTPGSRGTMRTYFFNQKRAEYVTATGTNVLPAAHSFEFAGDATQTFPANLRGRLRVDYFSNFATHQLYQANIYDATRNQRSVSGAFSGAWGRYDAGVSVQRTEIFSSTTQSFIYGSSPRISGGIAPTRLLGTDLYAGVTSDFSNVLYEYDNGTTSSNYGLQRFDVYPTVRLPFSKLSFLTINSSAGLRTTYYSHSLDARTRQVAVPVTRNYAQFRSEVVGPVFVKMWDTPGSVTVERRKHVIEPSVTIDYTTNFDVFPRIVVLSDTSDLIAPGNTRLTYGVTNRLLNRERGPGGKPGQAREFLTVGVQQSYYTNTVASQFDTTYLSLFRGRPLSNLSPIAVTSRLTLGAQTTANGRVEYDIQGLGLTSVTTGASFGFSNGSTGSINWSRQRPLPTQPASAFVSGTANLRARERRLGGIYSLAYDIGRRTLMTQQIVGYYNAQCCGFAVELQKYNFPAVTGFPIPSDTRINFSFTLAGLGTFSNFNGAMSGIPR